jgi:hypothetical protein
LLIGSVSLVLAAITVAPGIADAALTGSASISGAVVAANGGSAIADFEVCAVKLNTEGDGEAVRCEPTGADGGYAVGQLPAGEYQVEFSGFVCSHTECVHEYVTLYYGDKRALVNATKLTLSAGESHSGVNASVVPGGRISGTVTNNSIKHQPIADTLVCALQDVEAVEVEPICVTTNPSGAYTAAGLQAGVAYVEFTGGVCSVGEETCAADYEPQFDDHEPVPEYLDEATPIAIIERGTASGVDASLAQLHPVKPTSTAPPQLTGSGAIAETLHCSEGEWANYPTALQYVWRRDGAPIGGDDSGSYVVAATDEGDTISCEVVASNGAGSTGAFSSGIQVPKVVTTIQTDTTKTATTTASTTANLTAGDSSSGASADLALAATATATASVKGAVAMVHIFCPGGWACEGELKLIATATEGVMVRRNGELRVIAHKRRAVIGTATFSVSADDHRVVRVVLTEAGEELVRHRAGTGVRVQLEGSDIQHRVLRLKELHGPRGTA